MKTLFVLSTFTLLFSGCSHQSRLEKLKQRKKNSPVHQLSYWKPYAGEALEDRIFEADQVLVDYLNLANEIDGYPQNTKATPLSDKERAFFRKIIGELPKNLKTFVDKHVKGVFVVEELGGSGLTDGILSQKQSSFMVFDRKVFNKKANEWCTWKEHTVFKRGPTKLKCLIRKGKDNNEMGAFQFIFMHELAHVINRGFKEYLPFW